MPAEFLPSLVPSRAANAASDSSNAPALHPAVLRDLHALHDRLAAEGELRSVEALAGFYAAFRDRFGPDVLRAQDGDSLLTLMHDTSNRDGLVYWLEFKDDGEFPAIFGSIAGGSALKFGLYRRRETGAWMTGSSAAQREISSAEAIGIARMHRDQLLAACAVFKAFSAGGDDASYQALQSELLQVAPDVSDSAWGRKYLSLMFPDKIDDFHAASYQRFNLIKLLQLPPAGDGRYICAGRFVALAREFAWPLNHLTTVLNRRNGHPHRYWRIGTRAGDDGHSHWPMMRDRAVVAIGWSELGDLSKPLGEGQVKEWIRTELTRASPGHPQSIGRAAQQVAHFCQTIQNGDCVLASDGAKVLGLGRVAGDYQFDASEAFSHIRPVEWLRVGEWQLPTTEGLRTTVHELRKHPENLIDIERRLIEPAPGPPDTPRPPVGTVRPPLWTGGGTIGRVQDILERKGQVILYGPPGTGKTYWAEQAAQNLAALRNFGRRCDELDEQERSRILENAPNGFVRFCCFHPAYGYEDFIEGYRPVLRGNALHFELHDGLFKVLCDAASAEPARSFFLIVDEINRGDIPRIFGELLTLLERSRRGTALSLPLSGRQFSVPPNVSVIGTMNTADRSIALLDAALRRRFGFIELMPDPGLFGGTVVSGIPLGPWLDSLNRLIATHVGRDGRNLQVGHSYFLSGGRAIDDLARLAHVLQEDVLPLLEEYCYDDWETLERILGSGLVDVGERRFRMDLFAPGRQDDLVQAILAAAPDVSASSIAIAAEASSTGDVDESEPEGGTA